MKKEVWGPPFVLEKSPEPGQVLRGREFDNLVVGDAVDAERIFTHQGLDGCAVRGTAEDDASRAGILRPRAEEHPVSIMPVKVFTMRREVSLHFGKRFLIGKQDNEHYASQFNVVNLNHS